MSKNLEFHFRSQTLGYSPRGYLAWRSRTKRVHLEPAQTALLLCDVWDLHWERGANERLAVMLPRIARVVEAARARGMQIVHAPSDTMNYYAGSPARLRVLQAPPCTPPADIAHEDPPLPIDASDRGRDTNANPGGVDQQVWTRQHPLISVDPARDAVSDDGNELYSFYRQQNIHTVIILGVHVNMCVLDRSFAIKQLVRWGMQTALVRDLTDSMYSPARPPYVAHETGTRLVIAYIEKFWCPTISSEELL